MDVKEFNISTGEFIERSYTEQELQINNNIQPVSKTKSQKIREILESIVCVNETHLQKDIFISEAFGQLQGVTPQQLYQANPGYTSLIDARNAIEAIKAE